MPGVNAVGVSDKDAAMTYVATSWHERSAVPRLVLLDLYLPTPVEGLSVMTDLKDYFRSNNQPPMPVIVFSSSEKSEDIKASYDHGANSYMVKSADYRDWLNYFEILRQFWLQTVTLPPLKR